MLTTKKQQKMKNLFEQKESRTKEKIGKNNERANHKDEEMKKLIANC